MAPPNVSILSDAERAEILNLLHGAVARHDTGPRNQVADLWKSLIEKISGPKVLLVERR